MGTVVNEDTFIGENVIIQHHVTIGRIERGGVPRIGNGVSIGAYAIILGDIDIGENAKIGAGAVVTKSVPANVTVVGNPARKVNES